MKLKAPDDFSEIAALNTAILNRLSLHNVKELFGLKDQNLPLRQDAVLF